MKIGIPIGGIYDKTTSNAEEFCQKNGIILIRDSIERIEELFLKNSLDVALISPYGYFKGTSTTGKGDFLVIPQNSISIQGYSQAVSMYFKEGLATISTCASNIKNEYILKISQILMLERYKIKINIEFLNLKNTTYLKEYDAILSGTEHTLNALDITEDWYDTFKIPLPLAIWCGRNQEIPDNINEIISNFEDSKMNKREILSFDFNTELEDRDGIFISQWTNETEETLNSISELFYFHTYIDEVADINIFDNSINEVVVEDEKKTKSVLNFPNLGHDSILN